MLLKFPKILFLSFPRFGAMAAEGMRFSAEKLVWNRKLIITASRTLLQFQRKGSDFRAFSSSASDTSNQSRGRLPRFFSQTLPPHKGAFVRVEGDEFWHMTKVLRLNINDRLELFDGKGRLIEGHIEDIKRGGVDFEALEDPKLVSPIITQWNVFAAFGAMKKFDPSRITCLGTLKGGRADWLVEKCTELGASSVTPLLTKHSHSISDNRVNRLQRVILAASKQCQRLHEMILKPPVEVGELLPIIAQFKLSFVAVAEATPIFCTLNSLKREPAGVMIIGPEGDFTIEELNAMMEAGAFAVGLGPHRLRVETAAMSLLATLMLWSDSQESTNS